MHYGTGCMMCLDEAEQKDNWLKKSWIGAGVMSLRVLGHVRGPGLHATVAGLLMASGEFGGNQDRICFFKRWFWLSLTRIFGRRGAERGTERKFLADVD